MRRAEPGKTLAAIGCRTASGGFRSYRGLREAEVPIYGNTRDMTPQLTQSRSHRGPWGPSRPPFVPFTKRRPPEGRVFTCSQQLGACIRMRRMTNGRGETRPKGHRVMQAPDAIPGASSARPQEELSPCRHVPCPLSSALPPALLPAREENVAGTRFWVKEPGLSVSSESPAALCTEGSLVAKPLGLVLFPLAIELSPHGCWVTESCSIPERLLWKHGVIFLEVVTVQNLGLMCAQRDSGVKNRNFTLKIRSRTADRGFAWIAWLWETQPASLGTPYTHFHA